MVLDADKVRGMVEGCLPMLVGRLGGSWSIPDGAVEFENLERAGSVLGTNTFTVQALLLQS